MRILTLISRSMAEKPITQILLELRSGRRDSLDALLPLVYDELRRLARKYLSNERIEHTLQPTALVHEAYIRLVGQQSIDWQNRAHFFGVASRLMREILIDHARSKNRKKRGGEFGTRIELDSAVSFHSSAKTLDMLSVDDALSRLEKLDERQGKIVEMKFFGGMTIEEIASVLDISPTTVKREWTSAKLLLSQMLAE